MATMAEQLEEVLAQMKNPVEDEVQNTTGMVYGDSGGGKTVVTVRLAQALRKKYGGRILFIDAVNAWRSLRNHPELHEGLVRVQYSGKSQLDVIQAAIEFKKPGFDDIKVVILDELSSMTDKDGDIVLAARSRADTTKDPDVLTQPDMGATTERMRRSLIPFLGLEDISVLIVAHQRDDEDKKVGYKVTRPRFMPKFSGTIREALDFVVHMSATPIGSGADTTYQRQLQVHPTRGVVAKSRVGGLPVYVAPETFVDGVMKWLDGKVGDSTFSQVIDDTLPDGAVDDMSDSLDISSHIVE